MFRFLFGGMTEELPVRQFNPTMLVEAKNEVGEVVIMEVPKPIYLHQGLMSRGHRNQSFRDYDSERGQR